MILRSSGRILGCDGIKRSNRILPKETREEARVAKDHFYTSAWVQRELEGDAVGGELLAAPSVRAIMHRKPMCGSPRRMRARSQASARTGS